MTSKTKTNTSKRKHDSTRRKWGRKDQQYRAAVETVLRTMVPKLADGPPLSRDALVNTIKNEVFKIRKMDSRTLIKHLQSILETWEVAGWVEVNKKGNTADYKFLTPDEEKS